MNDETRHVGGLEDSAGLSVPDTNSIVNRFLAGDIEPHNLPPLEWALWSDGFRFGNVAAQPRIDRAEAAADYWYLRAHYSPAEIEAMQQKAISDAYRDYWAIQMTNEAVAS